MGTILGMLDAKEICVVMVTAKWTRDSVLGVKNTWIQLLVATTRRAKAKTAALELALQKVRDDDKRFAFLRKIKVASDPEFNRLIDDYICKHRTIGSSLSKPVTECRSFIYSGDIQRRTAPVDKKPEAGGFFSGWGLSNVFGMGGEVEVPGTVKKPAGEEKADANDSDGADLGTIANTDKHVSAETICGMLSKMAGRIKASQPEKLNTWLNQLQLCFGALFRSTLQFYTEARDVEKLKDLLVDRLETVKQKMKDLNSKNADLLKEIENHNQVSHTTRCMHIDEGKSHQADQDA